MSSTPLHTDFVLPILVSSQSLRQNYVFDLIFNDLIGIDYKVYLQKPETKFLSYGNTDGNSSIYSHGYIYEESVNHPSFDEVIFNNCKYPFATEKVGYALPFDLFATVFYFISRHEEYDSIDLDDHGRYKTESSWITKNGWLKKPIINHLTELLRKEIIHAFSIDLPQKNNYKVIPTIDIDNPYAFYGRKQSLLPSILKSLVSFDLQGVKEKVLGRNDKTKDLFNTHHLIIDFVAQKKWFSQVFFLMKSGGRNSINSIETIREGIEEYKNKEIAIGIHPSYSVNCDDLIKEKNQLELIVGKKVTSSRYHFIQSVLPKAYQNLIAAKVGIDYSMGYANQNGFRAGICNSFYWFDLEKNERTPLRIVPFCFMDATYIFNLKESPKEALSDMMEFVKEVKKYKGELSFIFHNESLSDMGIYKGWRQVWNELFESLK